MKHKRREDVIRDVAELERYLDDFFATEHLTFDEWVKGFSHGLYRDRNNLILELVKPFSPVRVLEFACAGPFLARLLLENIDSIERYMCSNFSTRMVEYCAAALKDFARCDAQMIDADIRRSSAMHRQNLLGYDLFITTSLEHIEHDRDLVRELPPGSAFVFSVALFDDNEHFRVFETPNDLDARYGDLLDIRQLRRNQEGSKLVVAAIRRRASECEQVLC